MRRTRNLNRRLRQTKSAHLNGRAVLTPTVVGPPSGLSFHSQPARSE